MDPREGQQRKGDVYSRVSRMTDRLVANGPTPPTRDAPAGRARQWLNVLAGARPENVNRNPEKLILIFFRDVYDR